MRGYSYRFAAVFLLLWAAFDLSMPQMCLAERITLPGASQHTVLDANREGQIPPSDGEDGDCFCCCMHVIASKQFQTAELTLIYFRAISVFLPQSDGSGRLLSPPPRS